MKSVVQYLIVITLTVFVGAISCSKEKPSASPVNPPPQPPPPPPPIPPGMNKLQLIQFGKLSQPRYHLLAATAGNKMLFVGGRYFVSNAFFDSTDNSWWNAEYTSSRVDIYDTSTQSWSITELGGSNYDAWSGSATVGNKIFFSGGYRYNSPRSTRIDIYDAANNSWSFITMPTARRDMAAASLGNKIFFAGGNGTDIGAGGRVDIYDVSNHTWSIAALSQPRSLISGVSFGNKLFFAGGIPLTTRVDIYNGSTQSWSTAELSAAKYLMRTATAGNKLLFDGGDQSLNAVDIYNDSTQSWSSINASAFGHVTLFRPTASLGNNAFFFVYGSQVTVYNGVSNSWTTEPLNPANSYGHKAAVTVGNNIFLAGGFNELATDKVWKLQF